MIPSGRHTDWVWPFSLIPRKWTAFEGPPPELLAGNVTMTANGPKPIPDPGQWELAWPPYFALQTRSGWHFRVGVRYDDVDDYYQFPSFKLGHYNQK